MPITIKPVSIYHSFVFSEKKIDFFFSKLKCGKNAQYFPNFGIVKNFLGLNWSWIGIASAMAEFRKSMVEFEIEYVEISGIMGWLSIGRSFGIGPGGMIVLYLCAHLAVLYTYNCLLILIYYRLGQIQLIINKYAVRYRYSLWPIKLVKD